MSADGDITDHYFALRLVDRAGNTLPEERFYAPAEALLRARSVPHGGGEVVVVEEPDDTPTVVWIIGADDSVRVP